MSRSKIWFQAVIFACGLYVGVATAQEEPATSEAPEEIAAEDRASPKAEVLGVKPFNATLTLNSPSPIVVGDDISVSVRLVANEGIDIERVFISLKGPLSEAYRSADGSRDARVACPLGPKSIAPGRSTMINCRLASDASSIKKLFGLTSMVDTQSAQVEVEIQLKEGLIGADSITQNHFEYVSVGFVSPKTHVIAGGFAGAVLWAIFLALTAPATAAERKRFNGWRSLRNRALARLPDHVAAFGLGLATVSQRAVVGSITALVLIVLAKSTEGMEPPISIRIQDFWGGMMIGILSTPLAKWLREKLSTIG
jgi:hypothetical protein